MRTALLYLIFLVLIKLCIDIHLKSNHKKAILQIDQANRSINLTIFSL